MIIKCFNEEVKGSNKNCKVDDLLSVYNVFFLFYFYSRSPNLYCFLREKWVAALKRAGCWVVVVFVSGMQL